MLHYIPVAKDGSFSLDKKEKGAERFSQQRETASPYLVVTTHSWPRRIALRSIHFPSCRLQQRELVARKCDRWRILGAAGADLQGELGAADL